MTDSLSNRRYIRRKSDLVVVFEILVVEQKGERGKGISLGRKKKKACHRESERTQERFKNSREKQ